MMSLVQLSQIANTDIPAAVLQRWEGMQHAKPQLFNPEKAVECFSMVAGKWRDIMPATIEHAITAGTPTIGAICKYMSVEDGLQVVAEMIGEAVALLNVGKNIRSEQIFPIARIIMAEHKHLTVADFRLLIRMGTTGKFGTTYDRLDLAILSDWCVRYFEMRCSTGESFAAYVHLSGKVEEKKGPVIPAPQYISDLVKSMTEKAEKKAEKVLNFQPDEAILKVWKADFDLLPADKRPTWEAFVQFQTEKIRKQRP